MSFLTQQKNGLLYHTSTVLEGGGAVHGFSSRLGGVSEGEFAALNLP